MECDLDLHLLFLPEIQSYKILFKFDSLTRISLAGVTVSSSSPTSTSSSILSSLP